MENTFNQEAEKPVVTIIAASPQGVVLTGNPTDKAVALYEAQKSAANQQKIKPQDSGIPAFQLPTQEY